MENIYWLIDRLRLRTLFTIIFSVTILVINGQLLPENDYTIDIEKNGIDTESGYLRLSEAPISVNVPDGFVFIKGNDTRRILTEDWGNSSDNVREVVGMLIPDTTSNVGFLDKGYILSYKTIGHVNDDRMPRFSFKKFLQAIKESPNNANNIVGWAWTPEYDMDTHRLSLPLMYIEHGTDSIFGGRQMIFGKDGLVEIEPISSIADLQWVYDHETDIANSITYNAGAAYSDYKDKPENAKYLSVASFLYGRPNPNASTDSHEDSMTEKTPFISKSWIMIFCALGCILLLFWFFVLITNSNDEAKASIVKIATNVLLRMGVFVTLYIFSIALGVFLIWLGLKVTIWSIPTLSLYTIIILAGMWCLIGALSLFLIKPLFQFTSSKNPKRIEIKHSDAPELFKLIEETAQATGVNYPKRVFVSSDVNACVFYNTTFWNIFFPARKNIEIGLGLLFGLNKQELKAVIAHEFGHFGQNSMKIGSVVSVGYEIIGNLVNRRDFLDQWLVDWQTSNSHWVWRFFGSMTAGSIGGVRKLMYRIYVFVQKGFLGLSRQMEYDADKISADTVGNEIAISALCKIDSVSDRFETFNSLLSSVASSKNVKPQSYWRGYEIFLPICESFDGKKIEPSDLMTYKDADESLSKVQINNPWLSHPTLKQRIDRIQETTRNVGIGELMPATAIVPSAVYAKVSETLYNLANFESVSDTSDSEFSELLATELSERSFPLLHRPYFNRNISGGFNPNDPTNQKESNENPFTEENTKTIEIFSYAISDYHIMKDFKNGELKEKVLRYNDVVYKRKNVPLEKQLDVVNALAEKVNKVDQAVFHYALGLTENKSLIIKSYDNIFFSQFIIEKIKENLFPNREILNHELMRVTARDENEFIALQQQLVQYKNAIKYAITKIEMERLYPVIHVDMWKRMQEFLNEDLLLNGMSISGEEISDVFSIPDQLVELFENLAYYSKKIVSDIIEGREPLIAWNNSMALAEVHEDKEMYNS